MSEEPVAIQVAAQMRDQLCGAGIWDDADTQHPHDGLLRAIRGAGAQRPFFARGIAALLRDPDLRLRTGAVACLREVVQEISPGRVAQAVAEEEALFRDVRPAWRIEYADLEQVAAVAAASGVQSGDPVAIPWLRRLAAERSWGWYLLEDLARADTEWLLENAVTLVTHDNIAVIAATPADRRADMIARLSPWPPEKVDFLTRAFWARLPVPESQRLRALMWPEVA